MRKCEGISFEAWMMEIAKLTGGNPNPEYWDFLYDEDDTPQEAVDYIRGLPKGSILMTNTKNL